MTDPQSWVAPTYKGLADLLTATAVDTWDPRRCVRNGWCAMSSRT